MCTVQLTDLFQAEREKMIPNNAHPFCQGNCVWGASKASQVKELTVQAW